MKVVKMYKLAALTPTAGSPAHVPAMPWLMCQDYYTCLVVAELLTLSRRKGLDPLECSSHVRFLSWLFFLDSTHFQVS